MKFYVWVDATPISLLLFSPVRCLFFRPFLSWRSFCVTGLQPCCGRSCDSHLSRICNTNTYRHSIVQQIRSSTWKGQRGSEANKSQQWAKHIKHDKRPKTASRLQPLQFSLVEVHFASFPSIFFSSAACWGLSYFSSPFAAPPSPCDGWTPWKRVKSDVWRVTWPIWSKLTILCEYIAYFTWSYNWILHDFLIGCGWISNLFSY